MNKIGIIFSREYLSRVKKKSFLLTTIGVPLVIMIFYAVILYLTLGDNGEKEKIAVIDELNLLSPAKQSDTAKSDLDLVFIKNETEASFEKKYEAEGYSYFLFISKSPTAEKKYHLHSTTSASITTLGKIEDMINAAIRNKQLIASGIDPKLFDKATEEIDLENTIDSDKGSKENFAGIAYAVSFGCGFLIYLMMVIYGTQVMRGVTEEKTNRVAEVIVSSVKPFQLMMGKILGIGAVGLTQFGIWIILLLSMQSIVPVLFPDLMHQASAAAGANAMQGQSEKMAVIAEVMHGFSSLPITKIVLSFVFYFLGGYLTYASIFAAIGSVVSEDQQEAQQLVLPVMMPIIVGFVIMSKAVNDPNSTAAVVGSIFPLTSPIVMMGRITSDVPIWQMAISMLLLAISFFFFTWVTAKIYRTGILMYGKRPSWKEMIKWGFRKS